MMMTLHSVKAPESPDVYDRQILLAAAEILSNFGGPEATTYAEQQARHAAQDIRYFLRCADREACGDE